MGTNVILENGRFKDVNVESTLWVKKDEADRVHRKNSVTVGNLFTETYLIDLGVEGIITTKYNDCCEVTKVAKSGLLESVDYDDYSSFLDDMRNDQNYVGVAHAQS